ncbi:MAG: hypothetical protein GEU81_18070 [Nitriliruptorales bacterium]|nr:hypothetical protein [Nitriliruptorales bacterium]
MNVLLATLTVDGVGGAGGPVVSDAAVADGMTAAYAYDPFGRLHAVQAGGQVLGHYRLYATFGGVEPVSDL